MLKYACLINSYNRHFLRSLMILRSGLLWEVERLLKELNETDSLPQVLLMENPFLDDLNPYRLGILPLKSCTFGTVPVSQKIQKGILSESESTDVDRRQYGIGIVGGTT